MPIEIKNTVNNELTTLNDGTTIEEILYALKWLRHERERKRAFSKKTYVPNGKPRGRPRKILPALKEENPGE